MNKRLLKLLEENTIEVLDNDEVVYDCMDDLTNSFSNCCYHIKVWDKDDIHKELFDGFVSCDTIADLMNGEPIMESKIKIDEEVLKILNEDSEEKIEFRAPFFPGFYQSLFTPDYSDIEWELFNNPNSVPEELLDYCIENANVDDYEAYKIEVGREYIRNLENELKDILPNFEADFVEIDSPKYYNYETDSCIGICNFNQIKDDIKKYIENHKKDFAKWVKDNHSSYEGFTSFYSSDANEWDLDNPDHNELGSILGFILDNEGKNDDEFGLDYITYENIIIPYTVDLNELQNKFKFDIELESLEDLEHVRKEGDTYVYVPDNKDQLKLDLKYESRRRRNEDRKGYKYNIYNPSTIQKAYNIEHKWYEEETKGEDIKLPEMMIFIIEDNRIIDTKKINRSDMYTYKGKDNEYLLIRSRDTGWVTTDYYLQNVEDFVKDWNDAKNGIHRNL